MTDVMMRAGVCVTPGEFRVEQRPRPKNVPADWVRIAPVAVGICGTDYHILEGKHPYLDYPRLIGHELSARVLEDSGPWKVGDLVTVNPYLSCGTCRACQRGKPNCCYTVEVLGVHRDGGLCEELAVPVTSLYSAEGLTPIAAAMVEFLAIGAHAVRRSDLGSGDRVIVTGVGPIGIGTALFARLAGADVNLLDLSEDRLAMAAETFGFMHLHQSVESALASTSGEGFDVAFDATGHGGAIEAGFPLVGHGGSYVLVSVVKGDITFSDPEFHKREMRLIGSRNALAVDFFHVISSFKNGDIDADALCSATLSLEEFEERFADLAQDRSTLIKVIVTP